MNEYAIKVDDLLLRLLNDYHDVDASEVVSFFGSRAKEMLKCEPNINENNKRNVVAYSHRHNKTQAADCIKQFVKENKVYVLRGFYPETHIPFKMTLVKFNDFDTARAKVIIGLKEHYSTFDEDKIKAYEDAVSEAILLSKEVDDTAKLDYKYRDFKAMRPKGIELYGERKRSN